MTHAEAREIVRQAWRQVHGREPTPNELLYTQAIALLETGYGEAGQFRRYADAGEYNWGGIQNASLRNGDMCPAGWVPGVDQHPTCFRVFPTQVEAAAEFIRTLTTRHWPTIAAMRGSPEDVAAAMRVSPAYYTGPSGDEATKIQYYADAIRSSIRSIGGAVSTPATSASSAVGWFLVLGGLGAAYWAWSHRQKSGAKRHVFV